MGQCERIKQGDSGASLWNKMYLVFCLDRYDRVKKQINIAPNLNAVQHHVQMLNVPVVCPDFLFDKSMWYYKRHISSKLNW